MTGFARSHWPADTSEPVIDCTVGDLLRQAAGDTPDATALAAGAPDPARRRRWSYAQLLAESEQAARALLGHARPGERIAIWAPNLPEWVILEFAAALAGVTVVTANPALLESELSYVLGQSRATALFYSEQFRGRDMAADVRRVRTQLPQLRSAVGFSDWADFLAGADTQLTLPTVEPDAAAQIQYTSGTTGHPKGAVLRHTAIVNNARFAIQRAELGVGGTIVTPMPMFHTGGCVVCTLGPVWRRATILLVEAFEPGLVLDLLEDERAEMLAAVPVMLTALLEHPTFPERDLGALRTVISGATPIPPDLIRSIESHLGCRFSNLFGQTEASPVITQTRPRDSADDKAITIGQPLPQAECAIIDPGSQQITSMGIQGELCVRGYQTMIEYFDAPDATAAALDPDGWLHTGDLATMDDRGYFTITGRLKDMIIRGGENIYPREIEDCLYTHPGVADVAVLGVPDPRWGEHPVAVIRPATEPPPDPSYLEAHCRRSLAHYKIPAAWYYITEFPLAGPGKIKKFVLREQIVNGHMRPAATERATTPTPAPATEDPPSPR